MTLPLRLFIVVALLLGYYRTAHAQLTITSVTPNPVCAGSTILLTYKSSQAGTVYTYLYNANSTDFGEPQQTQYITASNEIYGAIPLAITQASGNYIIRLTSNTPSSATYTTTSSVTITSAPPAPTVNSVSYCQNSSSQPLSATASSGGTLNWYGTNANGGVSSSNAPIPSTSILGTTNYYVSQTINGCESPRAAISVTVKPIPTAPILTYNVVVLCQGSIAPALSAIASIGGTLNWYTTPTAGFASVVAPTPPTSVAGVMSYYVSQTVNGCEGPRAAISVITQPLPLSPSVSSITYCQGNQASPLTARAATGGNLLWYTTLTGGLPSYVAPVPPTLTPGTFTYYVSQSINFCEGPRAAINVTIIPKPTVSIDADEAILTPSRTSLTLTAIASVFALTWSTGETTPDIVINTAGVYSVTATATTNCFAIASATVTQSALEVIYSVKTGDWTDPTIWSTTQLPTNTDAVRLRHIVNIPAGYQAQAGLLSYDAGGQLQADIGSQLLLGTYD